MAYSGYSNKFNLGKYKMDIQIHNNNNNNNTPGNRCEMKETPLLLSNGQVCLHVAWECLVNKN